MKRSIQSIFSFVLICFTSLPVLAGQNEQEKYIMFPDIGCWGVVPHRPGHIGRDTLADMCKDIGVQWVRDSIRWHISEVNQKGNYIWTDSDTNFKIFKDKGLKIFCVLAMEEMNPLYEQDKNNKEVIFDALAKWAGATAEQYKGWGIVYEISNEPEVFPMNGYWNDPVNYGKMARKVAAAIKKADPDAKIAAMSVAWFDADFLTKAFKTGMLDDGNIDIISFHGYHRENTMPESRLAEDVQKMRRMIKKYNKTKKPVILIDSERGYAMIDFLKPKDWTIWRNQVYTRSEQAAYLARHYLTEISLGLEMSVWYKLGWGEENFSLYDDGPGTLTPMGYVYKNLSALLPENPKKLYNDKYEITLVDLPDKISDPSSFLKINSYLKSYLKNKEGGETLVIALWNPVEAFDGKILESRTRIGDYYYDAWRAISPEDNVEVPVQVQIHQLPKYKILKCYTVNLLAEKADQLTTPIKFSSDNDMVKTETLKIGPMPTVIVIETK